MRHDRTAVGMLLGSALVLGTLPAHATPSGAMLGNTCAGCHGTNGVSMGPAAPSIAGMSAAYFEDTMLAYKKGERPSTIMERLAKGYTEEEIKAMAEFFAEQKPVPQPQKLDAAKVKEGEKVYKDSCEACHDDNGREPDDDAGILGGQWLPYLTYSMEDFISGGRDMPKRMTKKVKELSPAQIEAVSQFFASQK
jgi:sulfide dehydrogenase cytochrome subunit